MRAVILSLMSRISNRFNRFNKIINLVGGNLIIDRIRIDPKGYLKIIKNDTLAVLIPISTLIAINSQ